MSSKDKDSKPLSRIKEFFRKGPIGSHTLRSEYQLTQEQYRDLSKESPLPTRLKVLKDLCPIAEHEKFANNVVEKLWTCIEDLFNKENPAEARHMAFNLTQCMIKGQSERLTPMRAQFFRLIKHQDHPEDVGQKLDLLIALTQNGKAIVYFEEEIGRFLLGWFPEIFRIGRIEDYLSLIDNTIHFNAAYLNEGIINGFLLNVCNLCTPGMPHTTMKTCLKIMSSIVAYSNMSPEALPKFVGALCLTVVIQQFCETSWMIMKNLLGTHLGHSSIYALCKVLQEPCLTSQTDLLRGGVFFIRMGLWTMDPLPNLQCPPSSILPSIAHAMKNNQPAVAYEVALAIQQLVYRYGIALLDSSWSAIVSIFSHILQMDKSEPNPYNLEYKKIVMDTMTVMESYIEINKYNGNLKSYYKLVEECAADRPEESMLKLLKYLSKNVKPVHHLWMTNLYNLMYKYFKVEKRTTIRVEALGILNHTYKVYRDQFEEELIERIVIPHLSSIAHDPDAHVRVRVIDVLLGICVLCESKRFVDILDILSTLLFRPCENPNSPSAHEDIIDLIGGLTELFVNKIHRLPSSHAIRIYHMLVNFLKKHYDRLEKELKEKELREKELQNKDLKERELKEKEWKERELKEKEKEKPLGFEACNKARYMIFDCFFKMRADALYHLGFFDGNTVHFSPYLCVVYRSSANSPPTQSPAILGQPNYNVTYISLRRSFEVIVKSLRLEKEWDILSLLITGITKTLQNKSLILGKGNNDLDSLVDALCNLVSDRALSLPESLNVKVSKSDFHVMVSLSLVNLASYHAYLDKERQGKLIRCIIKCIQSAPKNSKPCISALTICTLEMKEVMVKLLPLVLLDLSKMSPTNHVAVPILEFLSTMTQLPSIFVNFVSDQYMAVFAVALAYSNPFKFNHYIVSLAHHVIAVWFLKCRLNFRRDFVSFIIAGLKTNLQPYEDTLFHRLDYGSINQDSSDRKRSSSLTEQGSRRREERNLSVRMDKGAIKKSHVPNKRLGTFYEELNETCIDLMARYAFSPCSATPKRTPVAEFLLNGGQSMTWLVGNKLVTITTSGCSQKPLRQGLCEKCWNCCESRNDKFLNTGNSSTEPSRQNSNDKSNNSGNSPQDETAGKINEESISARFQAMLKATETKDDKYRCPCWCQGWAEVYIRRPTGVNSMIMRIQNDLVQSSSIDEFPLNEVSNLYFPSTYEELQRPLLVRQDTFDDNQSVHDDDGASGQASPRQSPSRQNSQDSVEDDNEDIIYEDGTRSRNPVRRSNSSPEMSAGWKNPFHKMGSSSGSSEGDSIEDKKGKSYSKDLRVSYEAIPEEIGGEDLKNANIFYQSGSRSKLKLGLGTSPPQSNIAQSLTSSNPKSLLSCLSCPGSSEPNEPLLDSSKTSYTVPPSPGPSNQRGGAFLEFPLSRPTTLPSSIASLQPLAGKPPQSPTQTSPRLARHASKGGQELQKSSSSSTVLDRSNQFVQAKERKFMGSIERIDSSQILLRRDKSNTISITRPRSEPNRHSGRMKELPKSGVNPSFVFLQLYHNSLLNDHNKGDTPLLIGTSDHVNRAVKILDKIPPYETHRVGVLYIREGQVNNEVEILRNRFGSLRYVQFLKNLGTLVKLSDTDPQILGDLEQNGEDGKFAYIWQDDLVRVTFHVATMMPNKETDPNCNNKKKHIGNDFVNIVYNESGEEYDIKTIKSQFNFASIIIQPLEHNINQVIVKTKDELKDLTVISSDAKVVSDENVAILTRQLALHANLASLVARSLKSSPDDPYASNWLERLRLIKTIRKKVVDEQKLENLNVYPSEENKSRKPIEDFTEYS